MFATIQGVDWAYSWRWYVDPGTAQPLCVDEWESVGPGRGVFVRKFGGFVDPNCLIIDKIQCEKVLRWWPIPLPGNDKGTAADRHVFQGLRTEFSNQCSEFASVYYQIDPQDGMHAQRLQWIDSRN